MTAGKRLFALATGVALLACVVDEQSTINGAGATGKSTFLRTLNRMNDVIPGAREKGKIMIDGKHLYASDVDPVALRRDVVKLLALHQPVAIDLRMIVAAIKINADLERIGDLAVNIAEAARRYFSAGTVPEQQLLPRMSEIAEAMLADALKAFITNSLGTAQAVLERDDTLDSLRDQVNRRLVDLMRHTPDALSSALELMLIGRHLERTGDHATNIAEDVFFVVAGEDIRHQMLSAFPKRRAD